MVDESVHNNPRDPVEERFARLEEKFIDISRNMALLMVALASKLSDHSGRLEALTQRSDQRGNRGENEDPEKELRKEPKKE
jgi:hypothetical protein